MSCGKPKITLYTDRDFKGCCKDVDEAKPTLWFTGFNNRVSSVEVERGVWVLYQHSKFCGRSYVVWEDMKINLPCDADNTITSLKPVDVDLTERPSITIYADDKFSGCHLDFEGVNQIPDLRKFGFNDKVSSVKVHGGAWVGYEDVNFKGRQFLFLKGCHEEGFINDNISSLVPITLPPIP